MLRLWLSLWIEQSGGPHTPEWEADYCDSSVIHTFITGHREPAD